MPCLSPVQRKSALNRASQHARDDAPTAIRRRSGEARVSVRKHEETIPRGVATEIDEDVDSILADASRKRIIVIARDPLEAVGELNKPRRGVISPIAVVVADDLGALMVMMRQQRQKETRHRMPPEISGNIGDFQPAIGVADVEVRQNV